jgi:hypothetical protein
VKRPLAAIRVAGVTSLAITDPALLERQNLSDEDFLPHFLDLIGNYPPREWTREAFDRGLRYPWSRPGRSYLLRDGETVLLDELEAAERGEVLERHRGRAPLIAFGSNAAPRNLTIKLAHHPEPEDREVLVLAGELRDLDVVACAAVSVYGAMPATLAASPGTSVDASLLLVTATQLTTLTWGEMPYRLGRLRGAPFTVEDGIEGLEIRSPLAFVSRWGAFAPEGVPAPLAAIPGRDRRTEPWTQRRLVDRAAEIVLGPGRGDAEMLTQAIHADPLGVARRGIPALRAYAQAFDYPDWVPISPEGTLPPG